MRKKAEKLVFAVYNEKVVPMDYVADPKLRFKAACWRVNDNAKSGYVVEGVKVYFCSPASRMAKLVTGEEAAAVLAKVGVSGT